MKLTYLRPRALSLWPPVDTSYMWDLILRKYRSPGNTTCKVYFFWGSTSCVDSKRVGPLFDTRHLTDKMNLSTWAGAKLQPSSSAQLQADTWQCCWNESSKNRVWTCSPIYMTTRLWQGKEGRVPSIMQIVYRGSFPSFLLPSGIWKYLVSPPSALD